MALPYHVYIMASGRNGTLYTGMTGNLVARVWQHKNHVVEGFTDRHDVTMLVWFEEHATAENAIRREKSIKRYRRQWKLDLIVATNPDWRDLYSDIAHP